MNKLKEEKMKKLLIFSFILAVTMGLVYSAGLTVTSPSGGTWYKGSTHNITWTPSACTSTNYKINIFKNTTDPANFVEQLLANGVTSKSWNVPMSYTNGTYIIRVKADDNSCFGDSATFQIADEPAGPTPGTITIIHPTPGEEFCTGQTETISWTSSGTLDSNLKVNIFRNTTDPANFVTQLTATTASGSVGWAVPAAQAVGTYVIRIKTNDEAYHVDSPNFTVANCGGDDDDGGIIDPGIWDRLKDKLRKLYRIPWWRNPKGPWPGPGPSPCLSCPVFEISKLKELLANAGLKEQVGVLLYNGNQKVADFGKFGPKARLGKGLKMNKLSRMGLMQNKVGLRVMRTEQIKMFEKGAGFKLVFINSNGAVLGEQAIILQQEMMK